MGMGINDWNNAWICMGMNEKLYGHVREMDKVCM